jgi:hypothetical protein
MALTFSNEKNKLDLACKEKQTTAWHQPDQTGSLGFVGNASTLYAACFSVGRGRHI